MPEAELTLFAPVKKVDLTQVVVPEERDDLVRVSHQDSVDGEEDELVEGSGLGAGSGEVNDGESVFRVGQVAGDDARLRRPRRTRHGDPGL